MPDQYLVGNGRWCSACSPNGRPAETSFTRPIRARRGCNECAGRLRVSFTAEEILEATLAQNRAARERRAG